MVGTAAAQPRMTTSGTVPSLGQGAPATQPSSQWVAVRGQAIDLAVTPKGDVYALDPDGRLAKLAAADARVAANTSNWMSQPGIYKRVRAPHDGSLWAIAPDDTLFVLRGSVWVPQLSGVRDVGAAPDGQTLILSIEGRLFDLVTQRPFEPAPPAASTPVEALVVDAHGMPWLHRQDRSIVRFDGIAWQRVGRADDQIAMLSAGYDGTVLGVTAEGLLMRYAPLDNTWRAYLPDGRAIPPLRHVALQPTGSPWAIARSGELLAERMLNAAPSVVRTPALFTRLLTWRGTGGPTKQVSIGEDGTVFTLAPDGGIWRRKRGNEWVRVQGVQGQIKSVAAGTDGRAWSVNDKGGLARIDGGFLFELPAPAPARLIAAGPKGSLWAVFGESELSQWNAASRQWERLMKLPDVPQAIAAGVKGEVWFIDAKGTVQTQAAQGWTPIPGLRVTSVDVGPEGTVYATGDDAGIYWLDSREMRWKPASGKAMQIAVGPGGAPWAVTAKNELLASGRSLDEQQVRESASTGVRKSASTIGSADPIPPATQPQVVQPEVTQPQVVQPALGSFDVSPTPAGGARGGLSSPSAFVGGVPASGASGGSTPTTSAFVGSGTTGAGTTTTFVVSAPKPATLKPLVYQTIPGDTRFKDVGIGANGAVYAASIDGGLMCFNNAGNRFVLASSGTVDRVAVTSDGLPWILDASGRVSRFDRQRGAWRVIPGFTGVDIAVGPDGVLWAAGNGNVYRYNSSTDVFDLELVQSSDVSFRARRVAGAAGRVLWAVTEQNQLMRCEKGTCRLALVGALDVAVAPDNTLYVLDLFGTVQRYDLTKKIFEPQNGRGTALAVGPGGLPWLVTSTGKMDAAGIFAASSRTINTSDCGTAFALAPAPVPPPPSATVVATADSAALAPGGALDLIANDKFNGRPATISDVTVTLDTTSSYLALSGGSVVVSSNAPAGSLIAGTYKICPRNVFGSCVSASLSISVTGATTAPTAVTAIAGNGQATVSFTAPNSTGGIAISGYTVVSNPGSFTASGTTSPITIGGLTNGTTYNFIVNVVYANGVIKASSPSNIVTPVSGVTEPSAPTIGTATAGNAQATVSFAAPASNGGSVITGYTATSSPGGIAVSGTGSPLIVTGLANGTVYTFTVRAQNAVGLGAASAASNSVTPSAGATVPGAPTIGTATAGNASAAVAFTAPASNGGSAITSYSVVSSPGGVTANGSASPITVTGLTNGTAYTFTVKATNAIGTGAASAASNSVTPAAPTVPGAPSIGTATAGNASAAVAFAAPASNGGSAITGYTVTSSPGGITGSGAASPITVSGLTNGTAYTFTVTATNAVGTGPASAASNSATPTSGVTVPGAPTIGTATAGNASAAVAFTAPASNGGSAITGYTVTSSPGGITGSGAASPITVTGLTNGTAYTFTVTATNAVGTGAASAASNSATPATLPGAPTIGTATAGNASAAVAFAAPASNGGSAITGYTVTSSPGGITGSGAASPITVTGLTNGTAYTFTVTATNAIGTGTASAASNSATPIGAPGAPTAVAAVTGNASANVSFTAPASNGGSAITGYTVTSSPGGVTAAGASSPITVTGLTNGTAYTFTVTATNAAGTGTASAPSGSVSPGVPTAPLAVSAAAGGDAYSANIFFTDPANTGGFPLASYTLSSSPPLAGLPFTFAYPPPAPINSPPLQGGTTYTFSLYATNTGSFNSPTVTASYTTPASTIPGAPTITGATPDGFATAGTLQVFFTPAADNGSPVTNYTVTAVGPGGPFVANGNGGLIVVNGLTPGQSYDFTITATNGVGTGPASVNFGPIPSP